MSTTAAEALRTPARRAPHAALRGLVTEYHGYFHDGMTAGVHHGLPSSTLTVVVAFDVPVDVGWESEPGSRAQHWSMLSGLHTGPALIHHPGFQHGVQLALTPRGSRVLLGAPAAALAGSLVPLEMPQAYDDMAVATTWSARFDVLDAMLLGRAAACDRVGIRGELAHAWQRIARTHGTVRVGELADEVGWSRRHLTERFTAEYGIGPKQAARIARFQRARALLEGGSAVAGVAGVATVASVADVAGVASVADVATRCGYADQAHLTRDFRALGGCTPTQWRRESLSFVQDGAAAG